MVGSTPTRFRQLLDDSIAFVGVEARKTAFKPGVFPSCSQICVGGHSLAYPHPVNVTFKRAPRASAPLPEQLTLTENQLPIESAENLANRPAKHSPSRKRTYPSRKPRSPVSGKVAG